MINASTILHTGPKNSLKLQLLLDLKLILLQCLLDHETHSKKSAAQSVDFHW